MMFSYIAFLTGNGAMKNSPFSKEAFKVFYESLDVMWKGMLGIFVVIAVFYLIIKLLGRLAKENR